MTPQAVIFDIGNVLIEWQPERFYDAEVGETRRREMFAAVDLHGMNDRVDLGADFRQTIYDCAEQYPDWCDEILCAWGVHGAHLDQHRKIVGLLESSSKPLLTLGTTKQGHPRHPLYVSYAVKPSRFAPAKRDQ